MHLYIVACAPVCSGGSRGANLAVAPHPVWL